jgi:dihydroorotate dehydrogenase
LLKIGGSAGGPAPATLKTDCFGLSFPNPLGLAAGFDKDAEIADALLGLGFGFVEIGTVTPKPQSGNDRPRLFRLAEDGAVINRMGFNSEGAEAVLRRLERRRAKGGIVGVNIGANKDAQDRVDDYIHGVKSFAGLASYLVINVSSPNTPGLRDLQAQATLKVLLEKASAARGAHATPLLVKIAPDLDDRELEGIAEIALGGLVDGVVVSNTTTSRPPLISRFAGEPGGLSGLPLFDLTTRMLAKLYLLTQGRVTLVGVGGIGNADMAWIKIEAGASLIQIYTALIYRGPALIGAILEGLERRLASSPFSSLAEASGSRARELAHHGLAGT